MRTPYDILREQASKLAQITNGLLEGRVWQSAHGETFVGGLDIVVPVLDNYVYSLLEIRHPLDFYPLTFVDLSTTGGTSTECRAEEEYLDCLRGVLSSKRVQRAIASLLSLVKAEK